MWPQTPSGRLAIASGSLAMRSRMCHLDRQSPRGRFGWLCATNNGGRLCDSVPGRRAGQPLRDENRVRAPATPPRAAGTLAEGARSASTATGMWDRCGDSETRTPTSKGIHRPASASSGSPRVDAVAAVAGLQLGAASAPQVRKHAAAQEDPADLGVASHPPCPLAQRPIRQ